MSNVTVPLRRDSDDRKSTKQAEREAEQARKRAAEERKRQEAERKRDEAARKREEDRKKREAEARKKKDDDDRKRRGKPTTAPTPKPTTAPTPRPTSQPTPQPTASATAGPTQQPTQQPTEAPTSSPTGEPTAGPTGGPSQEPTSGPTQQPSQQPTQQPTQGPRPDDDEIPRHSFRSQVDFSSDQLDLDRPVTEFRQTPHSSVYLEVFNRDLRFDDGATFEMWSFDSPQSGRGFPGPLIRPLEGEIFHATVHPSMGPHTIHWHGLEPDPRNDGVGHTSFEIGGTYTYQWAPEPGRPGDPNYGAAGTYFYHCHVNTVLHAQMGMFGPVIVDPVVHPDYPVTPGARRAFVDGPEYDIDTESILIPYSLDPRWHEMHHAAGLSGEDVGLNRFEPKHFYLMGGELIRRRSGDNRVWSLSALRANVAGGVKKPTLLRILNANYLPNHMHFTTAEGEPVRMAELIAHDGRPFRDTSVPGAPAPTCREAGYPLLTSVLAFGAAERYDVILHPPEPGRYRLRVEWEDWITGEILGVREVPITAA
ncbi:multicopper oxidase domain-containing protein [Arthrobacter sulfonylureivorans]|uniref:multicopper oxidase domain-containing protein n=1 Tax=Arthrobacter sulfonylureivorans TaxID=2486855 RepID=UPI0039E6F016